jgi:hypothetical protein
MRLVIVALLMRRADARLVGSTPSFASNVKEADRQPSSPV